MLVLFKKFKFYKNGRVFKKIVHKFKKVCILKNMFRNFKKCSHFLETVWNVFVQIYQNFSNNDRHFKKRSYIQNLATNSNKIWFPNFWSSIQNCSRFNFVGIFRIILHFEICSKNSRCVRDLKNSSRLKIFAHKFKKCSCLQKSSEYKKLSLFSNDVRVFKKRSTTQK